VIGGSARGARLAVPSGGTRPLSGRVKEALFGALEADSALVGGFLDLYAGSGAAGIEALSRGAERATFVEHDGDACTLIANNLRRAGVGGGRVVRADVLRYLADGRPGAEQPYRACVVDPPYERQLMAPTLALLGDARLGWLAAGALVVAKHFWRSAPAAEAGTLVLVRRRRFGETVLSYYRREEER
jgi:16S rRNA (guanine966-N2)-methyltransferase